MRNLAFLASPDVVNQATCFRRAFMEKTAVWSVAIHECTSTQEARTALEGSEHAFVAGPAFRQMLFEKGHVKGASARLSQGCDVMYRGGSHTIALAQLARSTVDCIEEAFIPLYGANVVVLGSGSAALDLAYECSRAGVTSVTLLDEDRDRAENNLSMFLHEFEKNRTSILDTEQSRLGHVTATRAYDQTSFAFGSFNARSVISKADLVFSTLPSHIDSYSYRDLLKPSQIICDPWGRSHSLLEDAQACNCDVVSWRSVMSFWGTACADLLIEFGNASLK